MLPEFDVGGGAALVALRAVAVAALLSAFGAAVFQAAVLPRALAGAPGGVAVLVERRVRGVVQASFAAALLALLGWGVGQAADMAGAVHVRQVLAALGPVLTGTEFGLLLAGQVAAVLAGLVFCWGRRAAWRRAALAAATVALALQAGHSHAFSMVPGPSVLLLSDVVHLFGAGAWLGGLIPLLLVVHLAPAPVGAMAARRFSPLGKLCLVALTGSAVVQSWELVETLAGLAGTAYGWMVLVKVALFLVLFGFAVANRYRFAPALLRGAPAGARRVLVRSLAMQTLFGVAIVAAASLLSSLPPAMHEQPVWPFPERPTLETVNEDPDLLNEVLGAALALGGAAVLLVVAVLVRRVRWVAACFAGVIGWFAVPHLDLLFVPAYPTSFYRSPTQFASASVMRGAALYPGHCAACHGAEGRGDGPAAAGLTVPAADLTAAHLWMHADGELIWWLTHGIDGPEGGVAMPGFGASLSEEERWGLIDFIRARNAGLVFQRGGEWSPPLPAPDLQARCADGRTVTLRDLRGGFVRVVIGAVAGPGVPGVTTVAVTADPAARPAPGLCIAGDGAVQGAYALVAGLPAAALPGAAFLVDGEGWLRALQRGAPEPGRGWDDPAALQAEIAQFAAHPIGASQPGGHAGMQM